MSRESRRTYLLSALSTEQINFILNLLAERLDELEGRRGIPDFMTKIKAREGIDILEGTDKRMGAVTLVGGQKKVKTTAIKKESRVFLSAQNAGTNRGHLYITNRVVGESFYIQSINVLDDRKIAWLIMDPIE